MKTLFCTVILLITLSGITMAITVHWVKPADNSIIYTPVGSTSVNYNFTVLVDPSPDNSVQILKVYLDGVLADSVSNRSSVSFTCAVSGYVTHELKTSVWTKNTKGSIKQQPDVFTHFSLQPTVPPAPLATHATNITPTSFTANWKDVRQVANYFLDVATDARFTSFVEGYNNVNVGEKTSYSVTGLNPSSTYFYRVRSYSMVVSPNSNTISITTKPTLSIISFTPTRNALNIAKNTAITISFDQDINPASISSSTVCINGSLSGRHTLTRGYNSATKTLILSPNVQFKIGELVSVTATQNIKSATGISLQKSCNWSFTIRSKTASGSFTQSSTSEAGYTPHSVISGDFDRDGDIDLAVANLNFNTVTILLNNGSGTFIKSSTANVGEGPWAVTAGDFDGDGDLDLAVVNSTSNTVSILRNNGSGTFTLSFTVNVGNAPWAITSGDFDGDGDIDLAVVNNSSNTVSILTNNGAGTFTQTSTQSVGNLPMSIAAGDFDGDGDIDLAVVNNGSNTISILTNDGSGTFTQSSSSVVGNYPYSITSGDLDGDGDIDLAVANIGSGTISILLNNGSGTFVQSSTPGAGSAPMTVISGDLDGDGDIDLAVVDISSNTISILKNNGSGSFTQNSTSIVDGTPLSVTMGIGDFDGDGDIDLAVTNYGSTTVSILMNSIPTPTSIPTITFFTPTSGPIGTTVTITGTNFNTTAANNVVYFGAVKAQVISANSSSLTVAVPIGTTYVQITVTDITTGLTAYSSKPFTVTFPSSQIINETSFAPKIDFTTDVGPYDVAIGDMGGDGKPDLITANATFSKTVSLFGNTSTSGSISASSFAPKVDFTTGDLPWSVAIGDVDGDGKLDFVVPNGNSNTISIFRNISTSDPITTSSFVPKVDLITGYDPHFVAIGDVDGDGKPDLVVTNYNSNTISVFRNISTLGSLSASSFAPKVDFATGTFPHYVAIRDIDGDGKPDLIVTNVNSNTVSVFRNICVPGSISASSFASRVDFATGSNPNGAAIGDIDGDGKLDLVVTNWFSGTISVFRNMSMPGSMNANSFAPKIDFTTGPDPYSVAINDVDGDGKPDLVVTNFGSNTVSVFKNKGNSGSITANTFASKIDFITGTSPNGVVICDIDGDGKPDLAVANNISATVSVFRNTISGSSPPVVSDNIYQIPKTTIAPMIDGKEDAVWKTLNWNMQRIYNVGDPPTTTTGADSGVGLTGMSKAMWDANNLYILFYSIDDIIVDVPTNPVWNQDGVVLYIDGTNDKTTGTFLKAGQYQFIIPHWMKDHEIGNLSTAFGTIIDTSGIQFKISDVDDTQGFHGWMTEIKIPLAALGIDGSSAANQKIGWDLQQDESDDATVGRQSMSKWWSSSDMSWSNASLWGTAVLSDRVVDTVFEMNYLPTGTTITVDGIMDPIYRQANSITTNLFRVGDPPFAESVDTDPMFGGFITAYPVYDSTNFYIFCDVVDMVITDIPTNPGWNQDGVWIFIDGTNDHSTESSLKAGQYVLDIPHFLKGNEAGHLRAITTFAGSPIDTTGIQFKIIDHTARGNDGVLTEEGSGYNVEVKIPLAALGLNGTTAGAKLGFELQLDNSNDASAGRQGIEKWWNSSNYSWANAGIWGTAKLGSTTKGFSKSSQGNNKALAEKLIPTEFSMSQNYPNPFNPSAVISYKLSAVSRVSLKIYDLLGREVATLVDDTKEAGYYKATFNASHLSSGIYFARLVAAPQDGNKPFIKTMKMLLTK